MSWLKEHQVGDEVFAKVSKMTGEWLGVITKINKSSASFRWYATNRHEMVDGKNDIIMRKNTLPKVS